MIPQDLRLKQNHSINKVFKNGQHSKSDHFFYKHTKNEHQSPKFCITVAKKLKLNKPQRNKLKRQISHIVYDFIKANPSKTNLPFNIVIVLHTIPKSKNYFLVLKNEIQETLNKLSNE